MSIKGTKRGPKLHKRGPKRGPKVRFFSELSTKSKYVKVIKKTDFLTQSKPMKCGQFHMHMHMHMHYYLQSCSHFYMPGSQDEHFQPSPCHNYFITSISVINVTTQLAVSIQEFTYIYVQKHIVLFSATS